MRKNVTAADFPPDCKNVAEWISRLRSYNVPEHILTKCEPKVRTNGAPLGCAFGVACIDTSQKKTKIKDYNEEIISDDLIDSYRSFYVFKAKKNFHMTWDNDTTPPENLLYHFNTVMCDVPLIPKPEKKRKGPGSAAAAA